MKYIDEYRDRSLIKGLVAKINAESTKPVRLMEVCGSHTMAIQKFGIPALLPEHVELLSGPGCPVCVTDIGYVDHAVALARRPDVILTTFGDMIRVPGSTSTLQSVRGEGAAVQVVYSSMEALKIAEKNPDKKVVFLGIGFETTTPTSAAAMQAAKNRNIDNFFVLSAHKLMKPAMTALIDDGVKIDGYICPGHVSIVTGTAMYEEISAAYKVGCVVTGFEPVDVLQGIDLLVSQFENGRPGVEIAYKRLVTAAGNTKAWDLMWEVFEPCTANWRGIGNIPESGMAPREAYAEFDAARMLPVEIEEPQEVKGCMCGAVLRGTHRPTACPLFGTRCTPEDPVGACMVSHEGACAAFYRYAG
ncbi:MAG: hydrogenase formation protein HypD [Spirochaeta sp.]|nr:hydrogenase formation protein HypD [Spirochaeta sp.]